MDIHFDTASPLQFAVEINLEQGGIILSTNTKEKTTM